ncbi:MAG: TetR/AcrR family transcriptional regulator [Melioribacteraceae bacterium]|jgi:AcrR family transcriptional regulator
MDEIEKILEVTQEKFFREGFYKTRMDELASELRMSKKTIYKLFPSKNDLVEAIALRFTEQMKSKILPILESEKNAVEKLAGLISLLSNTAGKIGDRMFGELKNHFPSVWQKVDAFRTEMMYGNITKVIDQGKREGLFLDYPTPIVMNIFINSIRTTVNPEFIISNNFSMVVAAETTFKIIVGGILTDKGKEIFNHTFNKN